MRTPALLLLLKATPPPAWYAEALAANRLAANTQCRRHDNIVRT